ncbi:hypothetical protein HDE_02593 [Halotydeus destructor]|nr:hypothetical protein HDE_02593 [Halotydeus destructor]
MFLSFEKRRRQLLQSSAYNDHNLNKETAKSTPTLNVEPRGQLRSLLQSANSSRMLDRSTTLPHPSRPDTSPCQGVRDDSVCNYYSEEYGQLYAQSVRKIQKSTKPKNVSLPPVVSASQLSGQPNGQPSVQSTAGPTGQPTVRKSTANVNEMTAHKEPQSICTYVKGFFQKTQHQNHHQADHEAQCPSTSDDDGHQLPPEEAYIVTVSELEPTYAKSQKYLAVKSHDSEQSSDTSVKAASLSRDCRRPADGKLASVKPRRAGNCSSQGTCSSAYPSSTEMPVDNKKRTMTREAKVSSSQSRERIAKGNRFTSGDRKQGSIVSKCMEQSWLDDSEIGSTTTNGRDDDDMITFTINVSIPRKQFNRKSKSKGGRYHEHRSWPETGGEPKEAIRWPSGPGRPGAKGQGIFFGFV